MQNNKISTTDVSLKKKKKKVSYENLPFYYNPYVSFYQSLYSDDFVFEELTVKFSVSTSNTKSSEYNDW